MPTVMRTSTTLRLVALCALYLGCPGPRGAVPEQGESVAPAGLSYSIAPRRVSRGPAVVAADPFDDDFAWFETARIGAELRPPNVLVLWFQGTSTSERLVAEALLAPAVWGRLEGALPSSWEVTSDLRSEEAALRAATTRPNVPEREDVRSESGDWLSYEPTPPHVWHARNASDWSTTRTYIGVDCRISVALWTTSLAEGQAIVEMNLYEADGRPLLEYRSGSVRYRPALDQPWIGISAVEVRYYLSEREDADVVAVDVGADGILDFVSLTQVEWRPGQFCDPVSGTTEGPVGPDGFTR
jgi:hypothetical protein